ncbi:putative bifunctional diguanylate cyclase/phosphodiesterase [Sphingomonas immobilis]|uniref:EAL domain-containing protein n=1 Tax=Sphingomonas immobilis TaxID=3063997 RepID=A0ABT8ZYZ1_9SPHN|nr:EAL domain-containing protein [Sphingomonas sp. CA1-15]MDO7842805.1 EAL domain-containing protein [Sphingomonas sp. CA1-15]
MKFLKHDRQMLWIAAITFSAILLFVATGSVLLSRALSGQPVGAFLVVALLLNVALILFSWFRHRELTVEEELPAPDERAYQLALRDPLTGLLNRRSLGEEGATLLAAAARRHKAVALMMIDVDRFKAITDLHGAAGGDALLRQVAAEITAALPGGSLAARIGTDEFACALLFDAGHPEPVTLAAERIVSRLAQPLTCEGLILNVSASIGIARSDADCAGVDALIRPADIATQAAMDAGGNRLVWFDPAMEHALLETKVLEAELRAAIPHGEIVPYFAQQVDLATGDLTGFEVLARWQHPQRGLLEPAAFIPLAEKTGLIADLSLAVTRLALLAARDWDPALVISINIAPRQLKDAWFAQKIIKLLAETGFPAGRLEIEITERALFDNLAMAQSILGSLKNQGVRLALDDFGKGYSGIAHLRALEFDRIKIDRSHVLAMRDDPESAAIVNAVARLGECFNVPVTAEGVADAATEERVRALGCTGGQGYLYGRPADVAVTRRLLFDRRQLREQRLAG